MRRGRGGAVGWREARSEAVAGIMSSKRSPEAKKRRGASANRFIEAAKKAAAEADVFQPPDDPGNLCRRCYQRPHVPLHELCRACRYYTRGSAT